MLSHKNTIKYHCYEAMLSRQNRLILCVCHAYGGGVWDKDLYADIVLRLWDRFNLVERADNEAKYVFSVARNTATKRMHYYNHHSVSLDVLPPDLADNSLSPEDALRYEEMRQALDKLPPDDQLLVSCRLDGMSYDSIANLTGKAVGTLRNRMSQIVKQLQICLNK